MSGRGEERRAVLEAEADFGVPLPVRPREAIRHFGARSCVRLLLRVATAQADVVDVFDDGNKFEAPGVEASRLPPDADQRRSERRPIPLRGAGGCGSARQRGCGRPGSARPPPLRWRRGRGRRLDRARRPWGWLPSVPPPAPRSPLLPTMRQSPVQLLAEAVRTGTPAARSDRNAGRSCSERCPATQPPHPSL